jgi:hypothetical protein
MAATFAQSAAAYADSVPDPAPAIGTISAPATSPSTDLPPTVSGAIDGLTTPVTAAPESDPKPAPEKSESTAKPAKPRGLLNGLVSGTVSGLGSQVDQLTGGKLGSIVDSVIPAHPLPIGDGPHSTPVPIFDGYPGHLPCCIPDLPWSPPGRPGQPRTPPTIGGAASHGSGIPAGTFTLLTIPRASEPAVRAPRTTVEVPVVARLFSASGAPVGPGSIPVQPLVLVASVAGHAGSDASAWLDPLGTSGLGSAPTGPVGTDDLFILHTTAKPSVSPD